MEKSLEERIRHAVDEGRKARSEYYDVIDLPNEQQLGAPAPNELIIELETRLGKKLPPSYRVFLSLYDGWRMVDGAMDLLSIGEMLEGAREKKISEWQQKALVEGDLVAAKSLVIGVAEVTPTKLLLNPEIVDDQGEWIIVQHHIVEECTYPNFLVWLEESIEEFKELIKQEKEDGFE
jgi:hypothetical protein